MGEGLWADNCYSVYVTCQSLDQAFSDVKDEKICTTPLPPDPFTVIVMKGDDKPSGQDLTDMISALAAGYEFPA